jgi:excisionase family DNA binding protein
MEVGVKDVAAQLGVSDRRVRQLIDAGVLPARRVSGRLLVEETAIPRSRPVGRPMSPRIAWAFISMLSGDADDMAVSLRELSRLEDKRRLLVTHRAPALLLRSWLTRRARLVRLATPPADIEDLIADPRVIPSGISDPRSGLSAGRELEGYVRPADVGPLMFEYLMAEVGAANVWLHVAERPLSRPAPLGLVIADLADHDGPREDARVIELLKVIER